MPKYSKSQKRSPAKNGGSRTKRTLKKDRRVKRRKMMKGGGDDYKFTNDELIQAYNNYVQGQGKNALFQLRMYVFPTLFTLTNVGKDTAMDRQNKVPEFWMKTDALETALTEDPKLNEKINGNTDLIKTLNLKTPAQKQAEKDRQSFAEPKKTPEEEEAAKWRNPYVI